MWRCDAEKLFDREKEKRLATLEKQLLGKVSGPETALIERKISWLRAALDLPAPKPSQKARPARTTPPQPPLTAAEVKSGAEYLVSIGMADLMTVAQRAALAQPFPAGDPGRPAGGKRP